MRCWILGAGVAFALAGCWGDGDSTSTPADATTIPVRPWPGACRSIREGRGGRTTTESIYDGRRLVSTVVQREGSGARHVVSRRYHHDHSGRKARVDVFEDGSRHSQWFSYDDHGRWIATETDATGAHDVVEREERGYDDAGRIVFRRTTAARTGAVLELHVLEYGDDGRLTEERVDDLRFDRERRQRIMLSHDDRGRVVERLHYDLPDDTLVQRDIYAYGPSGRLHALTRNGEIRQTHRYHHDDVGNLVRSELWDEEGEPIEATIFGYDCWSE